VIDLSRLPLKRRVALFAGGLGLGLSLLFGALTWLIAEDYEHLLVSAVLQGQAETVRDALAAGQPVRLPESDQLRGWLFYAEAPPADLPPAWAAAPEGIHENLAGGAEGLHLAVFGLGSQRLVYAIQLGEIEALESYLIGLSLLVVLIGGGGSALLAQWLAGRALRPLNTLAAAVEALPAAPQATSLARGLPDDGLQRLARAFDSYQQRLLDAEQVEREFFADASHELRSPVASLRGAAEVLLDDPETPERLRRRLQRIDRASDELGQLIDALLLTARADPPAAAAICVQPLLQEVCAALATRADARGVRVCLLAAADTRPWPVPEHWLRIALLNLLRALIDLPDSRSIELQQVADALEFRFSEALPLVEQRSDRGFPLRLVERLCRRIGLRLEHSPQCLRLVLPQSD